VSSVVDSFLGVLALAAVLTTSAACRQDMHDQPKYEPLEASDFYADGRASRPAVEGTVARGQVKLDDALYSGKVNGQTVDVFPIQVTRQVLDRGRERFDVYCSPCHGRVGTGDGMIVHRGLRAPPSLHLARLRNAAPGYFFEVMTNGFGAMPDYRAQVSVEDRWAIAAYIRALQLSQNASVADVPQERRGELDGKPAGQEAPHR
jgi:mono/diheme cytochrome c family protein